MSMIDTVRAAMVTAMKEHDKERKESLSMLLSALKNKQIDKREDLTEAEEFEDCQKGNQADQRDDGARACRQRGHQRAVQQASGGVFRVRTGRNVRGRDQKYDSGCFE